MIKFTAMTTRISSVIFIVGSVFLVHNSYGDGSVVDKVYHPYVDALENELEFRSLFQDHVDGLDNPKQVHSLSLGRSIGERRLRW
jgi:hypothetical protein